MSMIFDVFEGFLSSFNLFSIVGLTTTGWKGVVPQATCCFFLYKKCTLTVSFPFPPVQQRRVLMASYAAPATQTSRVVSAVPTSLIQKPLDES